MPFLFCGFSRCHQTNPSTCSGMAPWRTRALSRCRVSSALNSKCEPATSASLWESAGLPEAYMQDITPRRTGDPGDAPRLSLPAGTRRGGGAGEVGGGGIQRGCGGFRWRASAFVKKKRDVGGESRLLSFPPVAKSQPPVTKGSGARHGPDSRWKGTGGEDPPKQSGGNPKALALWNATRPATQ